MQKRCHGFLMAFKAIINADCIPDPRIGCGKGQAGVVQYEGTMVRLRDTPRHFDCCRPSSAVRSVNHLKEGPESVLDTAQAIE